MNLSISTSWMNGYIRFPSLARPKSFRKSISQRVFKSNYTDKKGIVLDIYDIEDILKEIGEEELLKSLLTIKNRKVKSNKSTKELVDVTSNFIIRAYITWIMEELLDNNEVKILGGDVILSLYTEDKISTTKGEVDYNKIKIATATSYELKDSFKFNLYAYWNKKIKQAIFRVSKKGIVYYKRNINPYDE